MNLPMPPEMFQDITVKRYSGAGSYVNGTWSPGTSGNVTVRASVQPLRPNELLHLPEGDRTRAGVKIYSDAELQTADEATGIAADEVTWDGEQWEVQKVSSHFLGLAHYKAIALRRER